MDLFRYQAAGQLQLVDHQPAYFSIDGGLTNLKSFDTAQDSADWSDDGIPDSFGYGYSGEVLPISDTDLKVMDVLGYTLSLGLNIPPVAHSDTNGLAKGATISVSAAKGVLANDSDPDLHDQLAVIAVDGQTSAVGHAIKGEYGSLTLNADGSYNYVANHHAHSDHNGHGDHKVKQDVFTYTISDGHGGVSTSTLSIEIFKNSGPRDTLIAGKDDDNFLFRSAGINTINNLDVHHETIVLPMLGVAHLAALLTDDPNQVGAHTAIIHDAYNLTMFDHVALKDLHAHNFHLI